MKSSSRYPWVVVTIFFFFALLHQADKLLIGPLTENIIKDFHITNTQMGAVSMGAMFVGAIFYPLWGYLYDRYSRPKSTCPSVIHLGIHHLVECNCSNLFNISSNTVIHRH